MSINSFTQFPNQKLPRSKKNKKWVEQCMDSLEGMLTDEGSVIRTTLANKENNYNLYSGVFDPAEMEKVFNPMGLKSFVMPAKLQNYPIEVPKFNLLIGEELGREFNWRVRVINEDAISDKERLMKQSITKILTESMNNPNLSEAELQAKIEKKKKYFAYEYHDMREQMSTRILKYLWHENDLKRQFNEGFKDALLVAEEMYDINIIAGQPVVRRINPKNIIALRSGESHFIEDSSIIIKASYRPLAHVIDDYHDELTSKQISDLEEGLTNGSSKYAIPSAKAYVGPVPTAEFNGSESGIILLDDNSNLINSFGGYINRDGEIREVYARWVSWRKIGFLTSLDPETGKEVETIVDERHQVDKDAGEKVKWKWIKEWWESIKIGHNIYLRGKPREVQYRKLGNPSICSPGIVGTYYATNDNVAVSLMDRVKQFKYQYNLYKGLMQHAISRYKGPIMEINISKKPKMFTMDEWLYYTEMMNYHIVDPFNIGTKGAATGKLAGNFNTDGRMMNPDMGNYIQHMDALCKSIDEEIDSVTGVSRQREGQIENRETTRGVERSVKQSSTITEEWFGVHDHTKKRVMEHLLETAKYAWGKDPKLLSYIDDDLAEVILRTDPDLLADSDMGIFITDGKKEEKLIQAIEMNAQQLAAQDKMKLSTLIDVYGSDSISHMRKMVEIAEEEATERIAKQQQEQLQSVEKINAENNQKEIGLKQMDIDLEIYKTDVNATITDKETEGKLQIEDDKQAHETTENALDRGLEEKKFNLDSSTKTNIANDNNKTKKEVEDKKEVKKTNNK